jgi:hypothetical protein
VGQFEAEIWEEVLHIMSDKGLFVFPTHEEVWSRNKSKLLELNSEQFYTVTLPHISASNCPTESFVTRMLAKM